MDKKLDIVPPSEAEFFTASAATYSALEDLQYGVERFNQFHKWCLDGVLKMGLSGNYQVHSEEIAMLPWKAIRWPERMVTWSKIGIRCGGQFLAFINDEDMPMIHDEINCVKQPFDNSNIANAGMTDMYIPFYTEDLYYSGGGSHYYGVVASNAPGFFKADKRNRMFYFNCVVDNISSVYLEYITDGVNPEGTTIISRPFFLPLQNYIHWKRKAFDKNFGEGERQAAKAEFKQSFDDALVEDLDVSIEDIMDVLRRHYTLTPKG